MSSVSRAIAAFTGVSLIGTLTQVIKGKITTALLGAEGIGVLDQIMRIPSALTLGATMGTYTGMIRHMAEYRRNENSEAMRMHFASTAVLVIALSFIFAAIGALAAPWLSQVLFADDGARSGLVALAMLTVPLACLGWCYRVALNAAKDISALARSRIIADVSSVFVLAGLAWWLGLWGAVLGYIALHFIFLIATWFFVRRLQEQDSVSLSPRKFTWIELRRNFGFGAAGLISTLAQISAALLVARWIIVEQNLAANGLYAMALKVSSVYLGGLSAATGGYVLPALSAAESQTDFDKTLDEALANGLIIVAPIAAGIMLWGDVLMHVLFSVEFVPAAILLLIMLPGDMFRLSSETLESALSARGRLWSLIMLRIGWSFSYAFVVSFTLPIWGLAGAALGYLITHGIRTAFAIILSRRGTGWSPSLRIGYLGAVGFALLGASSAIVLFFPDWSLRLSTGLIAFSLWAIAIHKDPIAQAIFQRLGLSRLF